MTTLLKERWPPLGAPTCPKCGHGNPYILSTRDAFKCRACWHQFSVTSGTIFARHKLDLEQLDAAWTLLVAGAGGTEIARALNIQNCSGQRLVKRYRDNGGALLAKNKGHRPARSNGPPIVGLSEDHPTHGRYKVTTRGAQANDVQSECPASTSVRETKTPGARDP